MLISNKKSVIYLLSLCKQLEIEHIVICPGSRNLPLILSFQSDAYFKCYSCIDERVAGFLALGIAKSCGKPAIVITTSGSAAINLGSAMSEAYYQNIPLIAITADRPPDLINKGENQTIIQQKIFTNYVDLELEIRENIEFASFEKMVLPLVNKLNFKVNHGNIHINMPFSEPLIQLENIIGEFQFNLGEINSNSTQPFSILSILKSKKTIIYLSTNGVTEDLKLILDYGIEQLDWIVICDLNSNYYHNSGIYHIDLIIISSMLTLHADNLITIGEQFMSKSMRSLLKSIPNLKHIDISSKPRNWNTISSDYQCICGNPAEALLGLKKSKISNDKEFRNLMINLEKKAKVEHINFFQNERFSEFYVVNHLMSHLNSADIYWGNSSVVRYANWSNSDKNFKLNNYTNRGVSGIDGVLASAIGFQIVRNSEQFYCILGDVSLLYEFNSLQSLALIQNIKIIVLNNKGGKIFENIHNFNGEIDLDSLTTPRYFNLDKVANLFDIQYFKSIDLKSFLSNFDQIKSVKGKLIWELEFDINSHLDWNQYFNQLS